MTNQELSAKLAKEAGQLAFKMRAEGLQSITSKTNISDIVTEADKAAEQHVYKSLRSLRPDDSIVGEEGANHTGTSEFTWVIDPVDGTYNFAAGSDYWCSAIAVQKTIPEDEKLDGVAGLIQQNEAVIVSAVYQATADRLWVGGPNIPTTCNQIPGELAGTAKDLAHACLVTYLHPNHHWKPQQMNVWANAVGKAATWRATCSASLDMALMTSGVYHVWAMRALPQWDRLPGIALLNGVGGVSTMFDAGGTTWLAAGPDFLVEEVKTLMLEGDNEDALSL